MIHEHFYVDDDARRLVRFPRNFDVVKTSNLSGDILADEAAELVGGLGMAPGACLEGRKPYVEPVYGSAPDIVGKGIVNPTAMILSAGMMLAYPGLERERKALEKAVAKNYQQGSPLTPDQRGKAATREFSSGVLKALHDSFCANFFKVLLAKLLPFKDRVPFFYERFHSFCPIFRTPADGLSHSFVV